MKRNRRPRKGKAAATATSRRSTPVQKNPFPSGFLQTLREAISSKLADLFVGNSFIAALVSFFAVTVVGARNTKSNFTPRPVIRIGIATLVVISVAIYVLRNKSEIHVSTDGAAYAGFSNDADIAPFLFKPENPIQGGAMGRNGSFYRSTRLAKRDHFLIIRTGRGTNYAESIVYPDAAKSALPLSSFQGKSIVRSFGPITFNRNSSEVSIEDPVFRDIRNFVYDNRGWLFFIDGHTDTQGGHDHNQQLALMRCQAVARTLQDNLFAHPNQLVLFPWGERSPLVPTADEVECRINRQVMIHAVMPSSQFAEFADRSARRGSLWRNMPGLGSFPSYIPGGIVAAF
ncbi:MAG TPA: OmpA family protein [Kiritimatiellia bacterium]|nr:OmpA family protein [Kiritimatiellia bacterium]HMP33970.1 OmpA family protein [Kiritimatiellia bacterium]